MILVFHLLVFHLMEVSRGFLAGPLSKVHDWARDSNITALIQHLDMKHSKLELNGVSIRKALGQAG